MKHKSKLDHLCSSISKPGEIAKVNVIKRWDSSNWEAFEKILSERVGLPIYRITGNCRENLVNLADELDDLAVQISEVFSIHMPSFEDWDEALAEISKHVSKGNCILFIDEISKIGKTHDDIAVAVWSVWERKLKNARGFTLIFAGADDAWLDEHIVCSAAWYGRVSFSGEVVDY